jgi:hypothetical protein
MRDKSGDSARPIQAFRGRDFDPSVRAARKAAVLRVSTCSNSKVPDVLALKLAHTSVCQNTPHAEESGGPITGRQSLGHEITRVGRCFGKSYSFTTPDCRPLTSPLRFMYDTCSRYYTVGCTLHRRPGATLLDSAMSARPSSASDPAVNSSPTGSLQRHPCAGHSAVSVDVIYTSLDSRQYKITRWV